MSFIEKAHAIITKCPNYVDHSTPYYLLRDNEEYFVGLEPEKKNMPIYWCKNAVNEEKEKDETSYPVWLKNLYFQLNELYFDYSKFKRMMDEKKKRSLYNIAYVYGCLYGDKNLLHGIKAIGETTHQWIPKQQKDFIKQYSECLRNEGYRYRIVEVANNRILIEVKS